MSDDKKIDREQAEKILSRAAALSLAHKDGEVSMGELEDAAQAAGLDRKLVRRAAAEIDIVPSPRKFKMTTQVVRRRYVAEKLGTAAIEAMLARADSFFGAQGKTEIRGRFASWSARHINISIEAHENGTMIQISERFVQTATSRAILSATVGFMTALMLTAFAIKGLAVSKAAILLSVPLAFVTSWIALMVARPIHEARVALAARSFEAALDSLESRALETARQALADADPTVDEKLQASESSSQESLPPAPAGSEPPRD